MTHISEIKNVSKITQNSDKLRITSLLTILWFVFIFNVENIQINGQQLVHLTTLSYVSLGAVGLGILAFPNLERINFFKVYLPILFLQQAYYFLVFRDGFDVLRLLYDAFALGITLLLLRRLAVYLLSAEDTLNSYLLTDDKSHIMPYMKARQFVSEELHHMRQLETSMALVLCRVYSEESVSESQATLEQMLQGELKASFTARNLQVRLGRFIMGITYSTDIIFEHGYGIAICLQDATREDAEKFLYQLQGFIKDAKISLWTSISMFPEDGAELDELLMNAKRDLKLYHPSKEVPEFVSRRGDVLVSTPDRVKLEEKAEWVNRLAFQSPSSRAIYQPVKRLMDIAGSGLALLLLSPLFGVIMLAIMLDDGGPFFFAQERVGLGGKTFKMHKFRSMIVNAPKLEQVEVVLPDGTIRYDWPDKEEDDPRITRVGRFLRKTSIDELPQLLDIFTGSMSLIGPRPSSLKLEDHTLHQTARLTVKPGLTGLWQVCDRHNKNFDERLLWDLKYVEKMGLWLDVQILFRTVGAVLKRSGV